MTMQFDAAFQAFQLLARFAEEFLPVRHFTKEQTEAIHKHAELIAAELTKPCYIYTPKWDEQGRYIPRGQRKERVK